MAKKLLFLFVLICSYAFFSCATKNYYTIDDLHLIFRGKELSQIEEEIYNYAKSNNPNRAYLYNLNLQLDYYFSLVSNKKGNHDPAKMIDKIIFLIDRIDYNQHKIKEYVEMLRYQYGNSQIIEEYRAVLSELEGELEFHKKNTSLELLNQLIQQPEYFLFMFLHDSIDKYEMPLGRYRQLSDSEATNLLSEVKFHSRIKDTLHDQFMIDGIDAFDTLLGQSKGLLRAIKYKPNADYFLKSNLNLLLQDSFMTISKYGQYINFDTYFGVLILIHNEAQKMNIDISEIDFSNIHSSATDKPYYEWQFSNPYIFEENEYYLFLDMGIDKPISDSKAFYCFNGHGGEVGQQRPSIILRMDNMKGKNYKGVIVKYIGLDSTTFIGQFPQFQYIIGIE